MALKDRVSLNITTIDDATNAVKSNAVLWLDGVTVSADGNELIFANTAGLCLTSPDNTKWRLSVDNNGVIITTEVV